MYNDNKELLDDFSDRLRDQILPHGSGINSDWDISYSNDAKIIHCSNIYDHMNEVGYYDAQIPFQVDIPIDDPLSFELKITGDDVTRAIAEEDNLSSYLEDTIAFCLDEHEKEFWTFAQDVNAHNMDLKEDVIMEGMKILSENRPRSEKEASSIRKYLEKQFDATDKSPEAFLYEIKENAVAACKSLNIAPPVRTWCDFMYAGYLTESKVKLDMPENAYRLVEKSVSIEQNEYGYTCVRYGAGRTDLAALTKSKIYANGKLIGEEKYCEGDELKLAEKYTIYGHGPLQNLLKKEFDSNNERRAIFSDAPAIPISYEPESKERFPGVKQVLEDFKKSGGKEITYFLGKDR